MSEALVLGFEGGESGWETVDDEVGVPGWFEFGDRATAVEFYGS